MATFDPKFAHDVLLLLAEAAYLPQLGPANLPNNYTVIGQITVDPAKAMALVAAAAPNHRLILQNLLDDGNFFGWVVQNAQDKTITITFRGTQDLEDWLHNIDFLLTDYQPVPGYGSVHQGFQICYQAVRDCVLELLASPKIAPGCNRLIITGHSLGAAISELAAPDILHNANLGLVPEVQNFAGPRTGHQDFASRFDVEIDMCFRVVNTWDIVPKLPPPLVFEHVGLAVHVDGGFTLDELIAHSLEKSYGPGLLKLETVPQAAPTAAISFPNAPLIGREP